MDVIAPGTIIDTIQTELGLTSRELAEQLQISEVWVYQLTHHHALPSFRVLHALLHLYLKSAQTDTRAHRQQTSRLLLRNCSDRYIDLHLTRITRKAQAVFQHESLLELTTTTS